MIPCLGIMCIFVKVTLHFSNINIDHVLSSLVSEKLLKIEHGQGHMMLLPDMYVVFHFIVLLLFNIHLHD